MTYEIYIERFCETKRKVTFSTSRYAETMEQAELIAEAAAEEGFDAEIFEVIED